MTASLLVGLVVVLLPFVAVLPWLLTIDSEGLKAQLRRPVVWAAVIGGIIVARVLLRLFFIAVQDQDRLEVWGRIYGAVLQILLTADFFVVAFGILLLLWPRGAAVALAAFREGIRQPLFWLLAAACFFLMLISLMIPYFTFGYDYKMMKHLGFDIVMLFGTLFVVITASLSISEEIEGRTAVTLLSKPLSRRQFLLGKFVGILLAGVALTALSGWFFNWALYLKPILDYEAAVDPLQEQIQPQLLGACRALTSDREMTYFLEGVAGWFGISLAILPGLAIGACQVMLLLAVAAALATRLPVVVNLLTCLVVFFLGNLAPYLLHFSQNMQQQYRREHQGAESGALGLVQFMAKIFDTVLPALEYFGLGPSIVRDQPLPLGPYLLHVGYVAGYSALYTAIALLLGLILFEDRDLA
jgi:ABC-type transport system involved in multi-copper enzyme maturation permease subunit